MSSQIKNIAKNSLIYGLGRVSSKIVGFILLPIYTAHLTVHDYGVLGIIEITSQVLVQLLSLRLGAALHRWFYDKDYVDQRKSIFFSILFFLTVFVLLAIILAFFFIKEISLLLFNTEQFSYVLTLMLFGVLFEIIYSTILTHIKLEEKALFYSTTQVFKLIIDLSLTVYLIVALNHGINGIYEAKMVGYFFFFLITAKYVLKNLQFKFDFAVTKGMIKYSLPLAISSISGILLSITDRYSLNYITGLSDVGLYSLGYKIANTTKIFVVSSMQLAISPVIFKIMDQPDAKETYNKILVFISILTIFSAVSISIFGKEIIELFAKNKSYWASFRVIPIISLSIFFGMLKDNSTYGIYLTKKTAKVPIYVFIVAIINFILNILFIPYWGTMGAALATLISQILLFVFLILYSNHYYPVQFEFKKIFLILTAGIIFYLISSLFNNWNITLRLILKSLILILFFVALHLTNLLKFKTVRNYFNSFFNRH